MWAREDRIQEEKGNESWSLCSRGKRLPGEAGPTDVTVGRDGTLG